MARRNHSRLNRQKKVRTKETVRRILIVCEGEKTEPNYFAGFQKEFRVKGIQNRVYLDIKPAGMVSLSLVKETIKIKEKDGEYYQVWCVFDRDLKKENKNQQNFNAAIKLAKKHQIQLAVSNDAFELWFLLHYEYYSSQTHRSELINKLCHKNRLGKQYQKNSENMYEILKDKQFLAIDNAAKIWNDCNKNYNSNPSITVFQLVETLKDLLNS